MNVLLIPYRGATALMPLPKSSIGSIGCKSAETLRQYSLPLLSREQRPVQHTSPAVRFSLPTDVQHSQDADLSVAPLQDVKYPSGSRWLSPWLLPACRKTTNWRWLSSSLQIHRSSPSERRISTTRSPALDLTAQTSTVNGWCRVRSSWMIVPVPRSAW